MTFFRSIESMISIRPNLKVKKNILNYWTECKTSFCFYAAAIRLKS